MKTERIPLSHLKQGDQFVGTYTKARFRVVHPWTDENSVMVTICEDGQYTTWARDSLVDRIVPPEPPPVPIPLWSALAKTRVYRFVGEEERLLFILAQVWTQGVHRAAVVQFLNKDFDPQVIQWAEGVDVVDVGSMDTASIVCL